MSNRSWTTVTKRSPCPICEHDHWCVVSNDGTSAICMWQEGGERIVFQGTGDIGHLFRLEGRGLSRADYNPDYNRQPFPPQRPAAKLSSDQVERIHARYVRRLKRGLLNELAHRLGVYADSLMAIRVGQLRDGVFAFPMVDGGGGMIGISFRAADGERWSERGGRNGLFVPVELYHEGPLLVVEGPTSLAALHGLDYDVIGRPSCNACDEMLMRHCLRRDVVIVADDDLKADGRNPGYEGAVKLARSLRRIASTVKLITPVGAKDAREWVRAGADRELVDCVIDSAMYFDR